MCEDRCRHLQVREPGKRGHRCARATLVLAEFSAVLSEKMESWDLEALHECIFYAPAGQEEVVNVP